MGLIIRKSQRLQVMISENQATEKSATGQAILFNAAASYSEGWTVRKGLRRGEVIWTGFC
jgi:hypothetical protein